MSQSSETSRPVARSQPLTHDPLKPHLAGMPEHHIALQVLELMGLTLPRYAAFRRGSFAYPRPEHRSGRDDRRRGRERASFDRLGQHGRERKAHPRLPLRPNSRARRGAWARTKEPRPLAHRVGAVLSGLGCNATRHQTNVPKQQGVPAAALRQPQSSVSLFAWLRFRVWGHSGKRTRGRRGPAHLPLRLLQPKA